MLLCSNYEEVYIDMVRSNAEWEVIIKEAYASGLPVYRWCRMKISNLSPLQKPEIGL